MPWLVLPWTVEGRLRRAESALRKGRHEKAAPLLNRVWPALEEKRRRQAANTNAERRALAALVYVARHGGQSESALTYCRTGRALKLDEPLFYEMPCQLFEPRGGPLSDKQLDDLVAWASWQNASAAAPFHDRVEAVLRKALWPGRQRKHAEALLSRLAPSKLRWHWPHLYRAELARLARQWPMVSDHLEKATLTAPTAGERTRLEWHRVHSLVLAEKLPSASVLLDRLQPDVSTLPREACELMARVAAGSGAVDRCGAVVIERLRVDSNHAAMITLLEDGCSRTGRWHVARPFVERIVAAAGIGALDAALQLQCAIALHTKDEQLAVDAARRILAQVANDVSSLPHLRGYAATMLAAGERLDTEAATALLQGACTPADEAMVRTAWLWARVNDGAPATTSSVVAPGKPEKHAGKAWRSLAALSLARWLLRERSIEQMVKAIEQIGPQLTKRDWLLRAGTIAALEAGNLTAATTLARMTQDADVGEAGGARAVLAACAAWQDRGDVDEAAAQSLLWLGIAIDLGVKLSPALAVWHAALERIDDVATGPLDVQLPPAALVPDSMQALRTYLAWTVEGRVSQPSLERLVGAPEAGPIGDWARRALAAAHVTGGRWQQAAELLDVRPAVGSAVLESLGAAEATVWTHRCRERLAAGEWSDAFAAVLRCVELESRVEMPTLGLAVAVLDAACADTPVYADLRRRFEVASDSWHADDTTLAAVDSQSLVRHGAWGLASRSLITQLRFAGPSHSRLHAYALVTAARVATSRAGSAEERTLALCEAQGAWAVVLNDPSALARFAAARHRCYGHGTTIPDVGHLRQLLADGVNRHTARCATDGDDPARLQLMGELERRGLELVAQGGGMRSHADAPLMICGPFLTRALGMTAAVRGLLTEPRAATRAQTPVQQLLAELFSPDAASDSQQTKMPARQRELGWLFSPLGPASVLLSRQQYLDVDRELNRVSDSSTGRAADRVDPCLVALGDYVTGADARAWLAAEMRTLRTERYLRESRDIVAKVPVDIAAARDRWASALGLAADNRSRSEVAAAIGEIAVGRANDLFRTRSAEERRQDVTDRRASRPRREDALALLSAAWDQTKAPNVQGPLSKCLNAHAVALAEDGAIDEPVDLLLDALAVKPNTRLACNNLRHALLARLAKDIERAMPYAGNRVIATLDRLQQLNPNASVDDITSCVEDIRVQTMIPFYNRAHSAVQLQDWDTAVEGLIWAMQIAPSDADAHAMAIDVAVQLPGADGSPGDSPQLQRLFAAMPAAVRRKAQKLLRSGGGRSRAEATVLNGRAVQAAENSEFAEAMRLLSQARKLDPSSDVIRSNWQSVGGAWFAAALQASDTAELARALSVMNEFGNDD
jgi:hypothetical protein